MQEKLENNLCYLISERIQSTYVHCTSCEFVFYQKLSRRSEWQSFTNFSNCSNIYFIDTIKNKVATLQNFLSNEKRKN